MPLAVVATGIKRLGGALVGCMLLVSATIAPVAEKVAAEEVAAETVAADPSTHGSDARLSTSWPSARGNAQSTGSTLVQMPESLVVVWETETADAIEASPAVFDDTVVVVDVMGNVTALDLASGEQIWTHAYDTGFVGSATIAVDDAGQDPVVLAGDIEGHVYAWSISDGKLRWQQSVESEIDGAPAVFQDVVLVTSQDGRLYAFKLDDGSPRWKYDSGDQIRCTPTIIDGQTLLGGCDAKLHRVNLNDGTAAGDTVDLDGPTGSTPAAASSVIVVPTMSGTVFGIQRQAGKIRWQYQDPDRDQEYRTDAAVNEDVAIVASARKNVDAISLDDGQRKWRYTLRRRADASPVIAGDDVWIAATDGRLVRLSVDDGTERWVHEIRGGYAAGPAIVSGPAIKRGAETVGGKTVVADRATVTDRSTVEDDRTAVKDNASGGETGGRFPRLVIADDEGVVRCFAAASKD